MGCRSLSHGLLYCASYLRIQISYKSQATEYIFRWCGSYLSQHHSTSTRTSKKSRSVRLLLVLCHTYSAVQLWVGSAEIAKPLPGCQWDTGGTWIFCPLLSRLTMKQKLQQDLSKSSSLSAALLLFLMLRNTWMWTKSVLEQWMWRIIWIMKIQ